MKQPLENVSNQCQFQFTSFSLITPVYGMLLPSSESQVFLVLALSFIPDMDHHTNIVRLSKEWECLATGIFGAII